MIVVDASALLEALLRPPPPPALASRIYDPLETLHAPHLLDVEVTQVIRRYTLSRQISNQRGLEAVDDLLRLPLHRHPHNLLLPRIWQLRNNVTAYDAVYIALAESLGAPLFFITV